MFYGENKVVLCREGVRLRTHLVSNSIKLVSMGGSRSGTAVTHTHTNVNKSTVSMENSPTVSIVLGLSQYAMISYMTMFEILT